MVTDSKPLAAIRSIAALRIVASVLAPSDPAVLAIKPSY